MKKDYLYFIIPAIALMIPLLAMQFTTEVNWGMLDFLVAGCLLFGLSFLLFQLNKISHKTKRQLLKIAAITIFSLIWIELAVGIFC